VVPNDESDGELRRETERDREGEGAFRDLLRIAILGSVKNEELTELCEREGKLR
jgi:hypothetical protein